MIRSTIGKLLEWWFIIVVVGALLGGATMAVSWSQTYGGIVGMSLGAMKQGVSSLLEGWNLTSDSPAPADVPAPSPTD